jgi:hypothetical protein
VGLAVLVALQVLVFGTHVLDEGRIFTNYDPEGLIGPASLRDVQVYHVQTGPLALATLAERWPWHALALPLLYLIAMPLGNVASRVSGLRKPLRFCASLVTVVFLAAFGAAALLNQAFWNYTLGRPNPDDRLRHVREVASVTPFRIFLAASDNVGVEPEEVPGSLKTWVNLARHNPEICMRQRTLVALDDLGRLPDHVEAMPADRLSAVAQSVYHRVPHLQEALRPGCQPVVGLVVEATPDRPSWMRADEESPEAARDRLLVVALQSEHRTWLRRYDEFLFLARASQVPTQLLSHQFFFLDPKGDFSSGWPAYTLVLTLIGLALAFPFVTLVAMALGWRRACREAARATDTPAPERKPR